MKTPLPNDLVYAEHASDIIAQGAALAREKRPFALITSLAIEGGAAREVGSLALVDDAGAMTGYLSNGCIDRDIQQHALQAMKLGEKKLIRYGDGSRFVDLKLPCGGALEVLIDPAPDIEAILVAAKQFAARQPVSLSFHGRHDDGAARTERFTYTPRHRLVLAGRGAIFRSMAQIGHATGYEVHLLSPDTEDLEAVGHVSDAKPQHLTTPQSEHSLSALDRHSAFVTLFHDHEWEPWLLQAALNTPALFVGSLGSMRTHEIRKDTLRQMGVPDAQLNRLRGPIGTVPSLRDASSIAISALAEIVGVFQGDTRETVNISKGQTT